MTAKNAAPVPPAIRFGASHVTRVICSGLLGWVGAIHFHLWSEGYMHIPTVGPLFLADAIGGFALAALLILWPRPLAGVASAGFMVSTLAGLVISINFGLFGFKESSGAAFVTESIILESVGAAISFLWVAQMLLFKLREIQRDEQTSQLRPAN
jgi:hypothetical protein